VEIVQDLSEEVRLDVDVTANTYLVLTDQYYPGWKATVNGQPTPIAVANHAFRMIGIPAGHSEVIFRYQPTSLRIGAMISAMTVVCLTGLVWIRFRRRPATISNASSSATENGNRDS
jgi:uncharacterized membrane protein YfhO